MSWKRALLRSRYGWRHRMPKYKTSDSSITARQIPPLWFWALPLWILWAPKREKSGVNNLSCKCIGFEDSAMGQDQLDNQIPDRSIPKATSIKVSLAGPRQTALHHRFLWAFVPSRWSAGPLQAECAVHSTRWNLAWRYLPCSILQKIKCI